MKRKIAVVIIILTMLSTLGFSDDMLNKSYASMLKGVTKIIKACKVNHIMINISGRYFKLTNYRLQNKYILTGNTIKTEQDRSGFSSKVYIVLDKIKAFYYNPKFLRIYLDY